MGADAERAVLVVESDEQALLEHAAWLAADGAFVVTCAGPQPPGYGCPIVRGEGCPVVDLARVIVLDLHLESDEALEGPPAWQLLLAYRAGGKPVVALAGSGDAVDLFDSDDQVVILPRTPEQKALLAAVRTLLRKAKPVRLPSRAPTLPLGNAGPS